MITFFGGIKMWDDKMFRNLTITRTCPQCGQELMKISDEGDIQFLPCDHYKWWFHITGKEGRDEVQLSVGTFKVRIRLWKRELNEFQGKT